MEKQGILPGMESPIRGIETTAQARLALGSLRFRRPDRSQMHMVPLSLDETIPAGHHVRVLWDVVERLDLSEFSAGLKVCQGEAGRPATDVRLLTALWLYAATQGVGSARELERLDRVEKALAALEEVKKVKARARDNQRDTDPYQVRETDSPEIAAWRTRMATEEARTLYKKRASTSETVNADLRTYRGVRPFLVRGLCKVRCVVLWSALAYNLMHFGKVLLMG